MNKLTVDNFTARFAQPNVASKSDNTNSVKKNRFKLNWINWTIKKKPKSTIGLAKDLINKCSIPNGINKISTSYKIH